MLSKAIRSHGRAIVLSLSPGPASPSQAAFLQDHAQLWRMSDDFWDKWDDIVQQFYFMQNWQNHIGPTSWPDADMLPLGKIGIRAERGDNRSTRFTRDEQITLMSLWSIFRSPLMFGGNLPDNDSWTLSLITNDEVLAVNQASINNRQVYNRKGIVAWTAAAPGTDDVYLGVFNATESDSTIVLDQKQLDLKQNRYRVRDLWLKKEIPAFKDSISLPVHKHGARLLKLSSR